MKIILFISLSVFFLQATLAQDSFSNKKHQNSRHLVILLPTQKNLEHYMRLVEEGLIDTTSLKLLAVYFDAENYDYSESREAFPYVRFHEIKGKIDIEDVYRENELSEEFKKIFRFSEGMIFNGGPDIPPALYGKNKHNLTVITDPYRHFIEVSLLYHLLGGENNNLPPFLKQQPRYHLLGICLGMQSMNVAAGGTLIQDIPLQVYNLHSAEQAMAMPGGNIHRNYYSDYKYIDGIASYYPQPIEIIQGRWLDGLTESDKPPVVMSSHHQATDSLGKDLRPIAYSADERIIEGIAHLRYPNVIGVQFHPELALIYDASSLIKLQPGDEKAELDTLLNGQEFHRNFWKKFFSSF